MCQLLLIKHMQYIRLILIRIKTSAQPPLACHRIIIYAHIMACCQVIRIDGQGPFPCQTILLPLQRRPKIMDR